MSAAPVAAWEAENEIIERAARSLGSLAKRVEIRNQARVHLWYKQKFGSPITPLKRSTDGIDRFLISCTCVGIEISTARAVRTEWIKRALRWRVDDESRQSKAKPISELVKLEISKYIHFI